MSKTSSLILIGIMFAMVMMLAQTGFGRAKDEVARLKDQVAANLQTPKVDAKAPAAGQSVAAPAAVTPAQSKPLAKPADAAPPANLRQGRGSMNLATVRNVLIRLNKGATPDAQLFRDLLPGYEGALIDGWDERTPELVKAKELLAEWYAKFAKDLDTCFRPDEPLLAVDRAPARVRSQMDKLVQDARATLAWVKQPVNTQQGAGQAVKKIVEECEAPLAQMVKKCQEAGKPAAVETHPAYLRVKQEIARIKAECEGTAGTVAGAETAAADAGKQMTALDATLVGNAQHEGLVPADCRELFEVMIRMVQDKDVDRHCRGVPQDQLARWLGLMPRMEKEVLPQLDKFINDLRQRYGADEAAFKAKMVAFRAAAKQNDPNAYYLGDAWPKLVKLEQATKNLPALKAGVVKSIMEFSQTNYAQAAKTSAENPDYNTKMKEQNFLVLVPNVQVILDVEPGNAKAKELMDAIVKGVGGVKAAEEKAITEAAWVGRTARFSGPGNPDELEKSILDFAKVGWVGSKENPYTVLAVAITDQWYSHKKNLLGDTIQWGLPVRVATKRASDKGNDVVAVWFLSVLTQEGPSVQKGPPWAQFAVGDSYRMRQAAFDKQVKK